jgi:hypothetical protein
MKHCILFFQTLGVVCIILQVTMCCFMILLLFIYIGLCLFIYPLGEELERFAKEAGFSSAKHYELGGGLMGDLVATR